MSPTDVIEQLAERLEAGDATGALALYGSDATFVVEPGTLAAGSEAIGAALQRFAAMRPTFTSDVEQVVYSGDLALVTNRWTLSGVGPDGEALQLAGRSADVLRRTNEGTWKIAIDDPWGGGQ